MTSVDTRRREPTLVHYVCKRHAAGRSPSPERFPLVDLLAPIASAARPLLVVGAVAFLPGPRHPLTNPSLQMLVERSDEGVWVVYAAWLDEPVTAESWEAAYWAAVRRRSG